MDQRQFDYQAWLQGVANQLGNEFVDILDETDPLIFKIVEKAWKSARPKTHKEYGKWINSIRKEIIEVRGKAIVDATKLVQGRSEEIAANASNETASEIRDLTHRTEENIRSKSLINDLTPEQLDGIIQYAPFGGKTIRDWLKNYESDDINRIMQGIQQGFTSGHTLTSMIRLVRGTQENNFADGALSVSRSSARMIARTITNGISNATRLEIYRENADVIDGVRFSSAFDSRTCLICGVEDRKVWPVDQLDQVRTPPLHPNCRCAIVPFIDLGEEFAGERSVEVRDFEQDAKDAYAANPNARKTWNELSYDTRRNLRYKAIREYENIHGKGTSFRHVNADTSFKDIFDTQPASFQRSYLGPKRYEAYKAGKLTLDQMVTPDTGYVRSIRDLGLTDSTGKGQTGGTTGQTDNEAEKRRIEQEKKRLEDERKRLDEEAQKMVEEENRKRKEREEAWKKEQEETRKRHDEEIRKAKEEAKKAREELKRQKAETEKVRKELERIEAENAKRKAEEELKKKKAEPKMAKTAQELLDTYEKTVKKKKREEFDKKLGEIEKERKDYRDKRQASEERIKNYKLEDLMDKADAAGVKYTGKGTKLVFADVTFENEKNAIFDEYENNLEEVTDHAKGIRFHEERTITRERGDLLWDAILPKNDPDSENRKRLKATAKNGINKKGKNISNAEKGADFVGRFIDNMDGDVKVGGQDILPPFFRKLADDERAHYADPTVCVTEKNDYDVTVHELGHWIETRGGKKDKIFEVFAKITKGGTTEKFGKQYDDDEEYIKPNIRMPSRYCTKIYNNKKGKTVATELLSMFMQEYANDPVGTAQKYPEYFNLMMEAIQ